MNMRMSYNLSTFYPCRVADAPADNIILIKIVDEDGQETDGLRITCHVHPRDQPFPPIENYEIAVNDVIESSSSSPSLILESIPSECFEISCTGVNDIGMTNASKTYCPRSDGKTIKLSIILLCYAKFFETTAKKGPFEFIHTFSHQIYMILVTTFSLTYCYIY